MTWCPRRPRRFGSPLVPYFHPNRAGTGSSARNQRGSCRSGRRDLAHLLELDARLRGRKARSDLERQSTPPHSGRRGKSAINPLVDLSKFCPTIGKIAGPPSAWAAIFRARPMAGLGKFGFGACACSYQARAVAMVHLAPPTRRNAFPVTEGAIERAALTPRALAAKAQLMSGRPADPVAPVSCVPISPPVGPPSREQRARVRRKRARLLRTHPPETKFS